MKENILLTLITIGVFGSFMVVHSIDNDYEQYKAEMAACEQSTDSFIIKEDKMKNINIATLVAQLRLADIYGLTKISFPNKDSYYDIDVEFVGYEQSLTDESFEHPNLGYFNHSSILHMDDTIVNLLGIIYNSDLVEDTEFDVISTGNSILITVK